MNSEIFLLIFTILKMTFLKILSSSLENPKTKRDLKCIQSIDFFPINFIVSSMQIFIKKFRAEKGILNDLVSSEKNVCYYRTSSSTKAVVLIY